MTFFLRQFLVGLKTMANKGSQNSAKLFYPAADRNKDPIKDTIGQYLQKGDDERSPILLEISSGSGQHVAHIASHYPWVTYQPTEVEESLFNSINAHAADLSNVKPAAYLDVREPSDKWLMGNVVENSVDYVLNVNMIHISQWKCTLGLFSGCGKVLKPGQYLFTYGPYAFDGVITPQSNVQFDSNLRSQHPEWGLKDVKHDLEPLAKENGLELIAKHSLPANNHFLVWQKKK